MPTILIVDDDAVDRELASRSLARIDGLEILTSSHGGDALEVLAERGPDLVLTDLRMPGMDGLELVDRIREDFPLVPIILMTSQGSEQLAVQALQAGASSYVPKRDLKEHLARTVQRVLEVSHERHSRWVALEFFSGSEIRFELANDPEVILPVVGFLQDGLERLGFWNPSLRTQVGMSLMEALSNAMIHGNLEVPSELREKSSADYMALIDRRRAEEPFSSRGISLTARESAGSVKYVIEDQGNGFDPSTLPDPTTAENLGRLHGRGLLLIRTFMDQVSFNDRGNRITMVKTVAPPASA